MKKRKILSTLMFAGLGLCLVSCDTNSNNTNTSNPTTQTQNSEYKIEIAKQCKLTQSFEGKSLFTDGIEECTLSRATDGDTSTFKLKSGGSVTARYLAIDTPESTAGYEKWGKAASIWNASILTKATSIVVEGNVNGSAPDKDSNGTRYLLYIWYKLEGDTEYTNLNLETVEMGYSDYTGSSSSCKYNSLFEQAKNKAKAAKKGVFGNEDDIYYPETIQTVNLKELTENPSKYYNKETQVPCKVAFEAYYVKKEVSNSFITATVEQWIDGKAYQYKLSLGYSGATVPDMFNDTALTRGSLFYICGFTSSDNLHGLLGATKIVDGDAYTKITTRFYYSDISDAVITKIEGNVITAVKDENTLVITMKDSDSAGVSSKYTVGSTISGHAYNLDGLNPSGSDKVTINFDGYMSQISTK